MKKQLSRIQVQRFKLMQDYPFYAMLLQNMNLVVDSRSLTAYTDGKVIGFNEDFCAYLSDEEVRFVLCHEVLHLVFMHLLRSASNCDFELYNIAADYLINWILVDSGIGSMPEGGTYNEKYTDQWTTEAIYQDLIEEQKNNPEDRGGGQGFGEGGGFDDHSLWGEGEEVLHKEEIVAKVISAMQAAKSIGAGGVPCSVERLINSYLEPQIQWNELVISKVTRHKQRHKNWSKFNRRFVQDNTYLPWYGESKSCKFCIAVDTSGSISEREANIAISECYGAIQQLDNYELYLMNFSHLVHNCKKYETDDEFDYKLEGSGGTDLSVITDYLVEKDIKVDSLFVITDNYTYCWPDKEYCDEITFLCTSDKIAPFGETIRLTV